MESVTLPGVQVARVAFSHAQAKQRGRAIGDRQFSRLDYTDNTARDCLTYASALTQSYGSSLHVQDWNTEGVLELGAHSQS